MEDIGKMVEEEGEYMEAAVGYSAYASGSPFPPSSLGFPMFIDGDEILYYPRPFSLHYWFLNHNQTSSRWLPKYGSWGGSKMNREVLAVVQSLVVAVLDRLETRGVHGGLGDMRSYLLTQHIENHVGAKKVRFRTELVDMDAGIDSNLFNKRFLKNDMKKFIGVLETLFDGGSIDLELKHLLDLLGKYPFCSNESWKILFLKNFPGLWDAQERSSFFINLYHRFLSDFGMNRNIALAYDFALDKYNISLRGWHYKIPPGSVYDSILRGEKSEGGMSQGTLPKFGEGSLFDIVRYIRVVLHHFREQPGCCQKTDICAVEFFLSQTFPYVLLGIYAGLCVR